jgi:hypothetical protein
MCMKCGCSIPNDKKSTVMVNGKTVVTQSSTPKRPKGK